MGERVTRGLIRGGIAAGVLLAWGAGTALLVRREFFRPSAQRLMEAALRVAPGASFYEVRQGGQQIGFASTTVDTSGAGITVTDYVVADLPLGGREQRASAQTTVRLNRRFAVRDFTAGLQSETGPIRVTGQALGDSMLVLAIVAPGARPDTQRVRVSGPVLLPTLVPLQVALSEPEVGKRYTFATFDPAAMTQKDVVVRVAAESLFVVADSAMFDSTRHAWVPAHEDTVRAWRIEPEGAGGAAGGRGIPGLGVMAGWVDAQGRLVRSADAGGIGLHRTAYEVAFENWRTRSRREGAAPGAARDILESTALGADALRGKRQIDHIAVRLANVDLTGLDLDGGRQLLRGDTLRVRRESGESLAAAYRAPGDRALRQRFRAETSPEPLIQSGSWPIVSLAMRIAGQDRDPAVIARKINRWVHDSLRKEYSVGVPSALQVLESRRGDCNEHTALFVALSRSLGIPSRVAAGLAFVNGKFYYHAWPEVWLSGWVAVDPTFGEFPADAAHLRFVSGGLTRQAELLRLIGTLRVDVLEAR